LKKLNDRSDPDGNGDATGSRILFYWK